MRGSDARKMVSENVSAEHRFVRWWRKENDFLDYELIDRFLENVPSYEEVGGVELLTMEQMINEVKRIGGSRVRIMHGEGGDRVEWHHGSKGSERDEVCALTPEALLTIYDVETRGNPVD
ncbi:hypothetical protein GURASL_08710 [Geotalea uraniireducens]|uniref:Uncharacterized protein n=1 Tax=Geotalea uraniireducens TaxID=351604 RepID=A0ABM8EI83_9BACT|nr:hypothetical protein [Geotalea uraniireducens]BDV41948.1 hypothetical protein GURASL_08710 [Geotalea uraniireducens]